MYSSKLPNKLEIFQEYYLNVKGRNISYNEALSLYSQMDADTKTDFEQYYKDETGYEIIVPSGYAIGGDIDDYSKANKVFLNIKYTLEAYAKEQGMILDPQWAIYSAEEIIQMEDNGVNIPQDVLDIAHSIYDNSIANTSDTDAEDGDAEATTEKEPFLDLIPKAKKKIEKCNETIEQIDEKIEEVVPEQKKIVEDITKSQLAVFKEYENNVTEWQKLKDKMDKGENLSKTEVDRYEELSSLLNDNKSGSNEFEFDKNEIAKSLNDMNILAVLGEKLADETIEIGDTLAEYTSKVNYKATFKEASMKIGFFAVLSAMVQGKELAQEASKVGNDTKEYTNQTQQSVNNIADVLDIKDYISTVDEEGNIVEPQKSFDEENNEQEKEEDKKDEFFWVSDSEVLRFIKEAKDINADLYKQIKIALQQIKVAKNDVKYAKYADKVVTKIVNKFIEEEKKRQEEISEENKVKKEAQAKTNEALRKIDDAKTEIEELEEDKKEQEELSKEYSIQFGSNNDIEIDDKIAEQEVIIDEQGNIVKAQSKIIAVKDKIIEQIQQESIQAREELKQRTLKEKKGIDKALPPENSALKINNAYQEQKLPEHNERMDFINRAGVNLMLIGTGEVTLGGRFLPIGEALMASIITYKEGLFYTVLGALLITKGLVSIGIGAEACVVSDDESLIEDAEISTDLAGDNINKAIGDLSGVNNKLAAVIKEYSTEDEAAGVSGNESENNAESVESAEASSETGAQADGNVSETDEQASTQTVEVSNVDTSVQETESEVQEEVPSSEAAPKEAQNAPAAATANEAEKNEDAKEVAEAVKKEDTAETKASSAGTSSSKKEDKEMTTDEGTSSLGSINGSAKDDSKDSEKVLKDTEKDEKQLKKETKKLEKEMKRDQKQIEKMTKESLNAAKKQQEILKEYEALTQESDQITAEEQAKQTSSQAVQAPQSQNDQQDGAITSAPADDSGAAQKLEANNQRINTLGIEFKGCERIITKNSTKIRKLQKSNKAKHKKFEVKNKVINQKITEAQKKEQEKQKRLAKQMGVVGVINNLFTITMSTGTALMCFPPTHAAGEALFAIGLKGTIFCALVKAIINIANGNWSAALIGLGTTAVTIAASCIPGAGAAVGGVMSAVSAGLSVVSSSAELVNNVRAIQGKEANGVMSKISTVAGVASSVASSASGLSNLGNTASTFGKALSVASVVGTAISSTSQIMSEFNLGDEKLANLLGTIGGGISLAASTMQIAQSLKNRNQNSTNEDKSNDTKTEDKKDSTKSKGASKAKTEAEIKELAQKPVSELKPEEAAQVKAYNEMKKAEAQQGGIRTSSYNATTGEFKNDITNPAGVSEIKTSRTGAPEGMGAATTRQDGIKTSTTVNGKSAEIPDAQRGASVSEIPGKAQTVAGSDLGKPTEFDPSKVDVPKATFEKKETTIDKIAKYTNLAGQAANAGIQVYSMVTDKDEVKPQKKVAKHHELTKKAREIRKKRIRRQQAMAKLNYKKYKQAS